MTPTEVIPLLVLVLLLVSAGGADVEQMSVTFEGDRAVEAVDDVLVVAGGNTTVAADASVEGDVYVAGGSVRVDGRLDGDVTVLAGRLSVTEGATVTGTVQRIAGEAAISDGARVGEVSALDPPTPANSPTRAVVTFLLQFSALGAVGWWVARRRPAMLDTVGHSITQHTVVSGVVGALAGATLLVLFVYMAFTLLLLPLSIVGLGAQLLVVAYAQVAFGYLVGERLPIDRTDVATVVGVGAFLLGLRLLGELPVVGGLVQFALVVVGFGAVLNTYFGLQRFEPATIPRADD